ncbi:MAG: hypothetical protein M9887_00830 [Chitinophagales bacterium]|nr:hypothetical protein [Chitinophagales bacterium]
MKHFCLLTWIFLLNATVYAQDFIGMQLGNYAGVFGLNINPAVNVNGPNQFDVNFFALGFSYESNYIYLEKSNIFLAGLKAAKLRPNPNIQKKAKRNISNPLYYNFFDRRNTTYQFYGNGFLNLPSGYVNIRNHSLGITIRDRFLGYANRISPDYGYYYYQDSATTEMWLDPMKLGLLHYGEIAFNYATGISTSGEVDVNIGATVKYIIPWDGIFLRNNVTKESIKIDNGVKIPEGADVDFDWFSGYKYDYDNDRAIYNLRKAGNGLALDFGFTIVNAMVGDDGNASKWKVGVAISDVGKIFIKKGEVNRFQTIDTVVYRDEYFSEVKDLKRFREIANAYAFTNDSTNSVVGSSFSAWMPASVTAFADFNVANDWYLSVHSILRLPMKAIGLEKSNTIALTARIERPTFELAIPVILHDFKYPRVGLFFRKGIFFIGSDNMTAWLVPQKLKGIELYTGLRWSGNISYRTKRKNPKRITLKCPVW